MHTQTDMQARTHARRLQVLAMTARQQLDCDGSWPGIAVVSVADDHPCTSRVPSWLMHARGMSGDVVRYTCAGTELIAGVDSRCGSHPGVDSRCGSQPVVWPLVR